MEQIIGWIREALAENQLAQGGLIVAVASFLIHWGKGLPGYIWGIFKHLVSCEFEVSEDNLVFQNLAIWGRMQKSLVRAYRYTVNDDAKHIFPVGSRIIVRRGFRLYTFYVSRDKVENSGIDKMFYLTAYLSVFPGSQKHIQAVLDEAADVFKMVTQTDMTIRISTGWSWRSIEGVPKRFKNTVFIPGTIKEDIIKDAEEFLKSRDWYRSHGVPWRRGYFLWGGSGTGKTTLVKCLATELNLPLYIIQLSQTTSNNDFMDTMNSAPGECIILLEDIDCATKAVETRETKQSGAGDSKSPSMEDLTLSGLLNAIDGCTTQEGRILIMTTNHPDSLDPALLRDGRVDLRIEIPPADKKVAYDIFLHFFPGHETQAEIFSGKMAGKPTSEIQGYLLRHKACPDKALEFIG